MALWLFKKANFYNLLNSSPWSFRFLVEETFCGFLSFHTCLLSLYIFFSGPLWKSPWWESLLDKNYCYYQCFYTVSHQTPALTEGNEHADRQCSFHKGSPNQWAHAINTLPRSAFHVFWWPIAIYHMAMNVLGWESKIELKLPSAAVAVKVNFELCNNKIKNRNWRAGHFVRNLYGLA